MRGLEHVASTLHSRIRERAAMAHGIGRQHFQDPPQRGQVRPQRVAVGDRRQDLAGGDVDAKGRVAHEGADGRAVEIYRRRIERFSGRRSCDRASDA